MRQTHSSVMISTTRDTQFTGDTSRPCGIITIVIIDHLTVTLHSGVSASAGLSQLDYPEGELAHSLLSFKHRIRYDTIRYDRRV